MGKVKKYIIILLIGLLAACCLAGLSTWIVTDTIEVGNPPQYKDYSKKLYLRNLVEDKYVPGGLDLNSKKDDLFVDEDGEKATLENGATITATISDGATTTSTVSVGGTYQVTVAVNNQDGEPGYEIAGYYDGKSITELKPGESPTAILKYKTVWHATGSTVGAYNNEELYTIEDALDEFGSGTIVVEYNTNFATAEDGIRAGYTDKANAYNVRGTLLVPYGASAMELQASGSNLSTSTSASNNRGYTPTVTTNTTITNQQGGYSTLTISSGIELNVSGKITINSILVMRDGPTSYIYGNKYGEIHICESASIVFNDAATFYCMGFATGAGEIKVNAGSVYEPLNVVGFKGHDVTLNASSQVFPLNQFTLSSIACNMTINSGVKYYGEGFLRLTVANGYNVASEAKLLGNDNNFFINLSSGTFSKSVDETTGQITFGVNGVTSINNLNILNENIPLLGPVNISTEERQIPIAGHFKIDIQSETTTIPSGVQLKLLPGAELVVEQNGTLQVNGAIYSYGQNNVSFQDGISQFRDGRSGVSTPRAYPVNEVAQCYRKKPSLGYDADEPAKVYVDGTLIVANMQQTILGAEISSHGNGYLNINTSSTKGTFAEDNSYGSTATTYNVTLKGGGLNEDGSYLPLGQGEWNYINGKWIGNYYQIVYNVNDNGDTIAPAYLTGEISDLYRPGAIENGTITTSDPTRIYHEFTGWYYDQQCTEKVGEISKSAGEGEVITVYAGWQAIKYNLKFITDNAGFNKEELGIPENITWSYGSSLTIPKPTNSIEGLEFSGWCIKQDYSGEISVIDNDSIVELTNNGNVTGDNEIVLYGQFKLEGIVTVRFDSNNNIYTTENEKEHKQNSLYDVEFATVNGQIGHVVDIAAASAKLIELDNELDGNNGNIREYYFDGWTTKPDGTGKVFNIDTEIAEEDVTDGVLVLYARWKQKAQLYAKIFMDQTLGGTQCKVQLTINTNAGDKAATLNLKSGEPAAEYYYYYRPDTEISYTLTSNYALAKSRLLSIQGARDANENYSSDTDKSHTGKFHMPEAGRKVTINAQSNGSNVCVVEGTLLTLADGTQKKVEDLLPTDQMLVFNHETGRYESCALWSIVHAGNEAEWSLVTYLKFSDGTELGIINEHALFDKTLNRYVYLNAENPAEYFGHKFVTVQDVNGEYVSGEVTLVGFENREEFVRVFSPVSLFHMNVVTNGLLSMTAWPTNSEGFENYFAFDENMKYDEEKMQADIERYGLYTYEDFKDLMTEDLFNALPWKYFKIAVGKGMMTWEDILYTIEWIYTTGQIQLD